MTAIRAYPRNLLLTIKLSVIQAKPRVPLGVLEKLRQNNICSVPKTHRGVSGEKKIRNILTRAALTTHELEWLEPWGKLAELELKCSNRELVYVGDTNVTQST